MYLKNLNALYVDMQKNDADSVVFAAQVEGHPFSLSGARIPVTLVMGRIAPSLPFYNVVCCSF